MVSVALQSPSPLCQSLSQKLSTPAWSAPLASSVSFWTVFLPSVSLLCPATRLFGIFVQSPSPQYTNAMIRKVITIRSNTSKSISCHVLHLLLLLTSSIFCDRMSTFCLLRTLLYSPLMFVVIPQGIVNK